MSAILARRRRTTPRDAMIQSRGLGDAVETHQDTGSRRSPRHLQSGRGGPRPPAHLSRRFYDAGRPRLASRSGNGFALSAVSKARPHHGHRHGGSAEADRGAVRAKSEAVPPQCHSERPRSRGLYDRPARSRGDRGGRAGTRNTVCCHLGREAPPGGRPDCPRTTERTLRSALSR